MEVIGQNRKNIDVRFFYSLSLYVEISESFQLDAQKNVKSKAISQQINNLEKKLDKLGYDISIDHHRSSNQVSHEKNKLILNFIASKKCTIDLGTSILSAENDTKKKENRKILSDLNRNYLHDIKLALSPSFSIRSLHLHHVVSREFIFQVLFEGYFIVKRDFSESEIKESGGVKKSLEDFFYEIELSLEGTEYSLSPPATRRRNSMNEYRFNFTCEKFIGFTETQVAGLGCYGAYGDASVDEVNFLGIDFIDIDSKNFSSSLTCTLEEKLPPDVELIQSEINYIDDFEEAHEISHEIFYSSNNLPENEMREKPFDELSFVKTKAMLRTIEIDIDSIPEEYHDYDDIIISALSEVARNDNELLATVYTLNTMSSNFYERTWSAFIGIASGKQLLDCLLSAFKSAKVGRVRYSDSIDPGAAYMAYHVQDGLVWLPSEAGYWRAFEGAEETPESSSSDSVIESDAGDDLSNTNVSSRTSYATRYRTARADAKVGTIIRKIEEVFGIPEGAVKLCGPDGRPLRADARIATLRKRWA